MAFDLLALFGLVCFASVAIAIAIAWFTYRWYAKLPTAGKYTLLAVLIVAGALTFEIGIGDLLLALSAILWIRDHLGR